MDLDQEHPGLGGRQCRRAVDRTLQGIRWSRIRTPRPSRDHYSLPSSNDDRGFGLSTVSTDMGIL